MVTTAQTLPRTIGDKAYEDKYKDDVCDVEGREMGRRVGQMFIKMIVDVVGATIIFQWWGVCWVITIA